MYYYVFEQPIDRGEEKLQEKIRFRLEELKIIGEIAKSNPVQRPSELALAGITKGYNTIVVVGSDSMVNKIASIVADKDITLGMIPTNPRSKIFELIGVRNVSQACDILPLRRIAKIDLGRVQADRYFLTQIDLVPAIEKSNRDQIKNLDSASAVIDFTTFALQTRASQITITNGILGQKNAANVRSSFTDNLLNIYIAPKIEKKKSFLNIFSKNEPEEIKYTSLFYARVVRVSASPLMAAVGGEKIIARTPIEVSAIPQALKIIVARENT